MDYFKALKYLIEKLGTLFYFHFIIVLMKELFQAKYLML